jgi:hypothetical protein
MHIALLSLEPFDGIDRVPDQLIRRSQGTEHLLQSGNDQSLC